MKKNLISIGIIIVLLALLALVNSLRPKIDVPVTPTLSPEATVSPEPVISTSTSAVASTSPLFSKSWTWIRTELGDGGNVPAASSSRPFIITFSEDNRFTLSTDCNAVSGLYSVAADGEIMFGDMISTKMYCEGSKEQWFTDWLGGITSYSLTDTNQLVLSADNDGGRMIFK